MTSIRALSSAQPYVMYLQRESCGQWLGSGAKELGLLGEVVPSEYRSVCRAENPSNGEYLLPIKRAERVDFRRMDRLRELGKLQESEIIKFHPREAYDLVLSSPKTVSIQGIVDREMLACHEMAVAKTVNQLEELCGGLVIAAFQHRVSRAQDPHIHTHLVVMNMRIKDDGWKALDAFWIYKNKPQLTKDFDGDVLRNAQQIGYKLDETGQHLECVSDDLFITFSRRSGEREDAIQQYRKANALAEEQPVSDRRIAALISTHRGPKQNLSHEQIRLQQLARITPAERIGLEEMAQRSQKLRLHLDVAQGEESGETCRLSYGARVRL